MKISIPMTVLYFCTIRGLAVSENISEDEDPESESVLGIVPHQVSHIIIMIVIVLNCSMMISLWIFVYRSEDFFLVFRMFSQLASDLTSVQLAPTL